ncbi:MAG TPA: electron transfer flavoprotein subunit beta [Paenibacillaceae bacterium]|nr:electron transfer flavoprotein subunit beta [Paenibacillaceae bacterium]
MNIIVCLKQTFDTEEKIVIENGAISEDGVEFIINPYDEYAVEEAIKLRDEVGGEVTLVTVGPDRAETALRTALAMGADRAVIVNDEELFGDQFTTAKVLATVLKDREYDLIIAGNMAVDNGSGQIGPRLAEELNIPQVTTITKIDVDGNKVTCERDVEGDLEIIETTLPVLVTAQQGLNEPRYPSLPGIMKAKKKPMERLDASDLNLDPAAVQSPTVVEEIYLPAKKDAGKILSGDLADQVKELVQLLHNEAKVV